MIVFNVDLDNTLIYSYRHDIGPDKIAVENYQGREISFITGNTYKQLNALKNKLLIVPTSTRSIEQYQRIDLQIGKIKYALVCNGGVLLVNGAKDSAWYEESLAMVGKSRSVLEYAYELLEQDSRRYFELRWLENLFLFTKCTQPEDVTAQLQKMLRTNLADVYHNKEKVYVVPASLNKGNALRRFRALMHAGQVIAAGDSEFDISMLQAADKGIAPHSFIKKYGIDFPVDEMDGKELFSEEMLRHVTALCS